MILLALGSNVGEGAAQLAAARKALSAAEIEILSASALHVSAALLPEGASDAWDSDYTNQILLVHTDLSPQALLEAVKSVEKHVGREDRGHWGPREIDVDIIAYNDVVLESSALCIPHKEMAKRDFVLTPLKEIAPDWICPRTQMTIAQLCDALEAHYVKDAS